MCQTMQTNSILNELANKIKHLSLKEKVKPKSETQNLKFCDFPIDRASNSIIPLCLENFSFQPKLPREEMLYHNLANRISELPDIKIQISKIINETQEIEQPDRLFFRDGKWQAKRISEGEKRTVNYLNEQLAILYTLLENSKLDHQIPEQLMDIGENPMFGEAIKLLMKIRRDCWE